MSTKYLASILVTLAVVYCGYSFGQDVRYNFVPGTSFTEYKTYAWVDVPLHKYPDQILDARIKRAIDSEIATKGLTRTTASRADLYLTYQMAVDQPLEWHGYGNGDGWRFGTGTVRATSSTIQVGTIVLDIYDVSAKRQIWTGRATNDVDPSKNLKNLQKGVAKLLKNYPPLDN